MKTTPLEIAGTFLLQTPLFPDQRGFFIKQFSAADLQSAVPDFVVRQVNVSHNKVIGTFRGLHFQQPPFAESKIVSCIRGAVLDFILDIRKGSPSFMHHIAVELNDRDRQAVIIPAGCAHGFITLENETELIYLHSGDHVPGAEGCINIRDPRIKISVPLEITCISDKDKNQGFLPADFLGI